jgi:hypothetical protein
MSFDFLRRATQGGISDERLPAEVRLGLAAKPISAAVTLQKIGTTAV